MANYDLGTARGTIELVYKNDGTKKAEADLESVGKKSGATKDAVGKLGTGLLAVGGTIAAGFAVAAKSAADFEAQMSAIQAVSGATGAEMDTLRNKALQIGKDTAFSASEAGLAIEELVKAGVSIPDIMNGAADATVALAAATGIELAPAATLASDTMAQFKIDAKDMTGVVDTLAGAANASSIDIVDLGESLKYVGPVASALGVSLDDASTAIAILGKNGIKGSSAGTALRSILTNLSPTTKKATKAFEELGLITEDGGNAFYTAEGKLKPLNEVVQILNDSTKDLSAQQKNAFSKTAFGLESLSAASVLSQQTAGSFDEMAAAIGKVSAADVAATRLDNVKGSLEALKGSLETVGIMIGSIMLPAIRRFIDGLSELVGKFIELSPATQKMIAIIVGLVGAFALVAGAAIKIFLLVGRIIAVFQILGPAIAAAVGGVGPILAALTGPIGLIILAVVALAAIFVVLYKKVEPFRNFINSIGAAIKGGVLAAFNALKAAASAVLGALQKFGSYLASTLGPVLSAAGAQIKAAFLDAFAKVQTAIAPLIAIFTTQLLPALIAMMPYLKIFALTLLKVAAVIVGALIFGLIKLATFLIGTVLPVLIQVAAFLISGFITAIAAVITIISTVIQAIIRFTTALVVGFIAGLTAVRNAVVTAFTFIQTIISTAFTFIVGLFTAVVAVLRSIWNAFWSSGFGQLVRAVINLVIALIQLGFAVIRAIFITVLNFIKAQWRAAWNAVGTIVRAAWNTIRGIVSAGAAVVRNLVSTALAFIRAVFARVWSALSALTRSTWQAIKAAISGPLQAARSLVSSVLGQIKSFISSAWSYLTGQTNSAWGRFLTTISTKINNAMEKVRAIRGRITGYFSGAASWLYSAGANVVRGLVNGLGSMIGRVRDKVNEITDLVKKAARAALGINSPSTIFFKYGAFTTEGFEQGLESRFSSLARTMDAFADIPLSTAGTDLMPARQASLPKNVTPIRQGATVNQNVNIYNPETVRDSKDTDKSLQFAAAFI